MKKWLSLLLVVCLTVLPWTSMAEPAEVVSDAVEEYVEFAEEAGETGLSVEFDLGEADDTLPGEESFADESPEDALPEIHYARVTTDTLEIQGPEMVARLVFGAVLLITNTDDQGRVWAAIDTEAGPMEGVVVSGEAQPLSEAEYDAYMDGVVELDNALYRGQLDYPLPAPACVITYLNESPEPEVADEETSVRATDAVEEDGNAIEDLKDEESLAPVQEAETIDEPNEETAEELTDNEPLALVGEGTEEESEVTEAEDEAAPQPVVRLNIEELALGVNESFKALSPRAEDPDGAAVPDIAFTYRSADAKVAKVTSVGTITGVKAGSTEILISAEGCEPAVLPVTVGKAPTKVTISPSKLRMGVGMPDVPLAVSVNSGAACHSFTYTSSNKKVAAVSADGVVTAVGKGSANIVVRAYNYVYAICQVTVTNAPVRVALGAEILRIGVGQESRVTASALDAKGAATGSTFAFEVLPDSPNPDCIALDPDTGTITGVAKGRAYVNVSSYIEGVSAVCAVDVLPVPADITIAGEHEQSVTIGVGETYAELPATLIPQEGEAECAPDVTWTSSDAKVAKVSASGVITGMKSGHAVITATTCNGLSATIDVTVKPAPWTVTLSPKTLSLGAEGMTRRLTATLNKGAASGKLTFTSSDSRVVEVLDEAGLIRAVGKGTATITVKTFNKRTATCKVTVSGAPASVVLSAQALTLGEGQRARLSATARDASGAPATAEFTAEVDPASEDPGCIELNTNTGEITALHKGCAVVRVRTHNGVSAECAVQIVAAPEAIAIRGAEESLTLGLREVYTRLACDLIPPEGEADCRAQVMWKSSDNRVVKVDAKGTLTAVWLGKAVVTATTHNGKTASIAVQVKNAPYTVSLSPKTVTLTDGMTASLTPSANSGAASGAYTFTSANPSVATVDAETGVVSAVGTGETTITAKSFNGRKATCKVIVKCQPAQVILKEDTLLLAEAQRGRIMARVVDAAGLETETTYSYAVDSASSDPGCVSVDAETGAVTGIHKGEALVRVTTLNGVYALCTVKVVDAPDDIALLPWNITIGVGESFDEWTLEKEPAETAAKITWTSSNAKVAKVDTATGRITGVKAGTATITAATHNGKTASMQVRVMNAPYSVTISPTKLKLSVGMEYALNAKPNANSASFHLTFKSNNPAVVEVTDAAAGTVRAVATGTANITVKTYNGRTAKCAVTVTGEPATATLSPAKIEIIEGQTAKLTPSALDAAGKATPSNWRFSVDPESQVPECVSVDEKGVVTGLRSGDATVIATTHNGVEGRATVRVFAAPVDIDLREPALELGLLESFTGLPGTVELIAPLGEEECRAVLSWRSSKKSVVSVNATTGKITGMKLGEADIIVSTHNGIEKAIHVTVKAGPTAVKVSPAKLRMSPGMSVPLSVTYNAKGASRNVKYTSSKPSVATVDEFGVVTAVARGSATITARAYNGRTGKATVKVTGLPDQVTMEESLTLAVGMTRTLSPTVVDDDGAATTAQYAFIVEDGSDAVRVAQDGMVTAVKEGVARVRVTTHNGVDTHVDASGQRVPTLCTVKVVAPPAEIRMDKTVKLRVGETFQLNPKLYTKGGKLCEAGDYEIGMSGDAASVSPEGLITALQAGKATVTVTAYNGVEAACEVQVTQRYRLFAAYSYFQTGKTGDLYFTQNNAYSVRTVLKNSSISGMAYDMVGMLKNPSKSALLNGIARGFADSIDSDVNVVYLCTHGYNYVDVDVQGYKSVYGKNPPTHYGMQLPGYEGWYSEPSYYITAEEIFGAVSAIRGRVILILDSCYSGEFITNMKSRLDAAGGRISVLTAAGNTKASYYNIKNTSRAVDYFTYFLLEGMGYDERNGVMTDFYGADTNMDGRFTVSEAFNYAKKQVCAKVPRYAGESWFKGNAAQTPRVYLGGNGNLVIYEPK